MCTVLQGKESKIGVLPQATLTVARLKNVLNQPGFGLPEDN